MIFNKMLCIINIMLSKINKSDYIIACDLRVWRAKYNITQETLAEGVGVSRQTILFIENGKYTPSLELALLLSEYFKTNINNIFSLKRKE